MGTNKIDLTGQKFNMLTVIEEVEPHYQPSGIKVRMWKCKCDCGNECIVRQPNLIRGMTKSCGCLKIPQNLIGKVFGRLTVLEELERRTLTSGRKERRFLCQCICGNYKEVSYCNLISKNVQSCGCLSREMSSQKSTKYNKYDLTGEYGIGYTDNIDPTDPEGKRNYFYFDLEDYDKIKNYCWHFHDDGLLCSSYDKKEHKRISIFLHRIIMNVTNHNDFVDHIKHKKYDNRKSELRIVTPQQNTMNKSAVPTATNVAGITKDKDYGGYIARIGYNNKRIYLGYFDNLEDAVKVRKDAEDKYFGEYSYDNSMKL